MTFQKNVILYCIKRHFKKCHILSLKNDIYRCRFIHNIIYSRTQFSLPQNGNAKFP